MTLTFDTLTLNFGCHVFKLCAEFERNRVIHGWIIDDLAHFWPSNFMGRDTFSERFSGMRGPNFTKLGDNIYAQRICFRFQISCSVSKRRQLKCKCCRNWNWNYAQRGLLSTILVLTGSEF